jgi:chitinase
VLVVGTVIAGGLGLTAGTASAADEPSGETVPAPSGPIVGGYLLQGTPNFSSLKMDLVTHFWWAFSTISAGKCTTASTAGINAVLAQRQKTPNLKVLRSIGGWGARGFSDVAATDASRKAFVASCIAAFVDNGAADGFDIDWEFPVSGGLNNIGYRAEDRENVNLLVDEFRTQLNAWADAHGKSHRDMLLTAALPAGRWQDSGDNVHGAPYDVLKSFDLGYLGRTLDWINLMTYDMGTGYSPISMFNQPLYNHPLDTSGDPNNSIDAMVKLYEAQGVPANKLSLGVEFTLSRGFQVADTVNNGLFRPWTATGCGSASMTNALTAGSSVLINWDPDVYSPYLWDPAQKRLCSYENAQSLGLRAEYAKTHGLNGVFTWELSGDSAGSQLRAIAKPFEPDLVQAAPAPTVVGRSIVATKGEEFSGEVAKVTGSSAASLTAEINWGDNTHSAAVVKDLGDGTFSVTGTHTYASTGSFALTIATVDPDPINSRMVNGQAGVGNALPVQQTITAKVAGGPLTLSVPDNSPVDIGLITLNGADQIVDGALNPVTVIDSRGTNGGWSLTGQVTDFQGSASGIIPAVDLGWHPTASVATGNLNLVHNNPTTPVVIAGRPLTPGAGLSTAHSLCSSSPGASTGRFTCGGALHLGVPFDTPVGSYSAVLTITLI